MTKIHLLSILFMSFIIRIKSIQNMNISNEDDEFFDDEEIVYTSNDELNKKIEAIDDVKHKSKLKIN